VSCQLRRMDHARTSKPVALKLGNVGNLLAQDGDKVVHFCVCARLEDDDGRTLIAEELKAVFMVYTTPTSKKRTHKSVTVSWCLSI
jgi:hypothetical protein